MTDFNTPIYFKKEHYDIPIACRVRKNLQTIDSLHQKGYTYVTVHKIFCEQLDIKISLKHFRTSIDKARAALLKKPLR